MSGEVSAFLYLLDQAYGGDGEHSLLANLASVRDEDWARPVGRGDRTIAAIAYHVASAKLMYHEYAFGEARRRWDDRELMGHMKDSREELMAWLGEVHGTWRGAVARLHAGELDDRRPAHWGAPEPLRELVSKMVTHDVYHAGEINHLRSQLVGEDRWPWEIPGVPGT
jgi:uncharacterized damage-inducible protein DinB